MLLINLTTEYEFMLGNIPENLNNIILCLLS